MIQECEAKATNSATVQGANKANPSLKHQVARKSEAAFCKGFAEGFGSVGHVFFPTSKAPSGESLLHLARLSHDAYSQSVARYKTGIFARYVGRALAKRLYRRAVLQSSGRGLDASKLKSDYCAAIAKVTKDADATVQQRQEELNQHLATMLAEFNCSHLARATNDR